jgi:hypothetical protein
MLYGSYWFHFVFISDSTLLCCWLELLSWSELLDELLPTSLDDELLVSVLELLPSFSTSSKLCSPQPKRVNARANARVAVRVRLERVRFIEGDSD